MVTLFSSPHSEPLGLLQPPSEVYVPYAEALGLILPPFPGDYQTIQWSSGPIRHQGHTVLQSTMRYLSSSRSHRPPVHTVSNWVLFRRHPTQCAFGAFSAAIPQSEPLGPMQTPCPGDHRTIQLVIESHSSPRSHGPPAHTVSHRVPPSHPPRIIWPSGPTQ